MSYEERRRTEREKEEEEMRKLKEKKERRKLEREQEEREMEEKRREAEERRKQEEVRYLLFMVSLDDLKLPLYRSFATRRSFLFYKNFGTNIFDREEQ